MDVGDSVTFSYEVPSFHGDNIIWVTLSGRIISVGGKMTAILVDSCYRSDVASKTVFVENGLVNLIK